MITFDHGHDEEFVLVMLEPDGTVTELFRRRASEEEPGGRPVESIACDVYWFHRQAMAEEKTKGELLLTKDGTQLARTWHAAQHPPDRKRRRRRR